VLLGFSIEGPSQAKIDCKDNGDGSADISYWPTAPGEYAVHILCNEADIPKSPYMADIKPMTADFDPTKVCSVCQCQYQFLIYVAQYHEASLLR